MPRGRGRRLEMAIVTLPPDQPRALRLQVIWDDPLAFMVGPRSPLAGRDRRVADGTAALPAVLPGPTTYTRGILEAAVHGGVDPQRGDGDKLPRNPAHAGRYGPRLELAAGHLAE